MQYDIRLKLRYDYDGATGSARHQVRVLPPTLAGTQRVVAASLSFDPPPSERADFTDFFGNHVTSIVYRGGHEALDIRMAARVAVDRAGPGLDVSPSLEALHAELGGVNSLQPDSPHHFLASTRYAGVDETITAYAARSASPGCSVAALAVDFCERIHADFTYDADATDVATHASDAFALRRGVCQDFTHIMIAGLRGLGIPAGYVSGFLRTIPPAGQERLEGADAMHAWAKVWCGRQTGWLELDPTNNMAASSDHITVGHGRDYSDVAPIVGRVKMAGDHVGEQSVDVVPIG